MATKHKQIIGRYELIELRGELLKDIPAKTDTGAHLSSINAANIRVVKKDNNEVLEFDVIASHPAYPYTRRMRKSKFHKTVVENSFGHKEERYVVSLKVKVGSKVFYSDFSLADRSSKTFPILLGRKLLNRRFLVDSSVSNIPKKYIEKHIPRALTEDKEDF